MKKMKASQNREKNPVLNGEHMSSTEERNSDQFVEREASENEGINSESKESTSSPANMDQELFLLIKDGMRGLLNLGREHLSEAAVDGRKLLELRSLKKDKLKMYEKLGREVEWLIEAGEINHPGLKRGIEKIQEIEEQMKRLRSEH